MGGLIAVVFVSALIVMIASMGTSTQKDATRTDPRCDLFTLIEPVKQAKEAGAIYKIEEYKGDPDVYVTAIWYTLPIDLKKSLDRSIQSQCYAASGREIYVRYIDWQTGKPVAISSHGRFRME